MANLVKFGTKRQNLYLDHLRRGARRGEAARAVGVSRETVRLHQKHDPDFAAAVEEAEMEAVEEIEATLYDLAKSGNIKAILVWLCNRGPDKWRWPVRHDTSATTDSAQRQASEEILARLKARLGGDGVVA